MERFRDFIKKNKTIVGMVHILALPGTPNNKLSAQEIIDKAVAEAKMYKKHGLNTVMIENMHDVPYTKVIGPEIIAMMTAIGREIKKSDLYCGIQILAGGNKEAMAVAKSADLDFIRAEGFVYAHVADEGYIESCAGELLRYRRAIGAEDVMVFTDIKKKHSSHSITADTSIEETAHTAEFFLADGVIITGISTGTEASPDEVERVRKVTKKLVLIGSGITDQNLKDYFKCADVFIVGSYIKKDGLWSNEIDEDRVEKLMTEFNNLNR